MSDLKTEFKLACPVCGEADRLHVQITCTAELTVDGTEPFGDHKWTDDGCCHCPSCEHTATVADFEVNTRKKKRREP